MNQKLRLRTQTPIWTGGADGTPDGLKMSGILGSMRAMMEGLVRENGGRICPCMPPDGCILKEKKDPICPVCRIFGCNGLSRAFKLNWDLPNTRRIGSIPIPMEDLDPKWRNRNHDCEPYEGGTSIDTWIASPLRKSRGIFAPSEHKGAQDELRGSLFPAYSPDFTELEIIPLRTVPGIDLFRLLSQLLTQMADRYALGAKVNQGWGFFELAPESRCEGVDEIRKLVELYPYSGNTKQHQIPEFHYQAFPEIQIPYQVGSGKPVSDTLGFSWESDPLKSKFPFIALGFALQYRLRRIVKFEAIIDPEDLSDEETELLDEIRADGDEWGLTHKNNISQYHKFDLPWKEEGAYAEYLFGSANNEKHAGMIGISHLYRKPDGQWYVRMISQCPEKEYAQHVYEEFQYQMRRRWKV